MGLGLKILSLILYNKIIVSAGLKYLGGFVRTSTNQPL